jgi:hypothetical protein
LLVGLILLQPFNKVWILISFKINQERIAQTLCEQREIKNNTCEGKCHLEKQLKKVDQEEQKRSPIPQNKQTEVLYTFSLSKQIYSTNLLLEDGQKPNFFYQDFKSQAHLLFVFKPPQLI